MKKIIAFLLIAVSFFNANSQGVVISQVYGGGGNSGSVYTNDFIELFNASASPVSLNGWSVQYASATGTGAWQVTNLTNFTLQPGQYYLVQEAVGTGGTVALPSPDAVGTIAMSGTAGKVALVNNTTALNGACPGGYIDQVGFGATANCFEGTGPTPAPSNTNSVIRGNNGCLDNNQNATDFTSVTAAPRNSTFTPAPCGGAAPSLIAAPTTIPAFANTTVGSNSASQTFSLSGSALTGAPGNITITAPSTDFQVSKDNITFASSTTVAYSSATLAATTVYVRFTPQTPGAKSGNVSITGGGVASAVTVAVSGTGLVPPPAVSASTASLADFGNIVVLNNSTSQTFNISGTNLTGFPGNITISAPTDFQVSNDNATWGASTTVAYTAATLASTPVYARFSPLTLGAKTGNISITGGGIASPVLVAVSGTSVAAPVPSITVSALAGFGSLCLNTTSAANSFAITGVNLTTANVTVAALAGYTYSTTAGGTYTTTLSLAQAGGSYSQTIFVKFTPVAVASYNGNIAVGGGGTAAATNVAATGAGVSTPPSLTTGGSSAITSVSATLAGTVTANGCTALTAAYGIEYSTVNGFANGAGTQVVSTNISAGAFSSNLTGLLPSTTYYYKAYATNAGGVGYGAQQQFTTATPVLSGSALTGFGSVCLNATAGPNSFTITGINLTAANVSVGPLAGYTFSTTSGGTYTNTLSITQPGGAFSQAVFVKFTPTATGNVNGNIPVSGGAAATISVPVTGAGVNTPPSVATNAATVLSANDVTLAGTVSSTGCSAVTSYGFEYSGISGFPNGSGRAVVSSNLSGANFSAGVSGLVQAGTYYYKAYAVNNGGITYGPEQSFTMKAIPAHLTIYSSPIKQGGNVHFTLNNIRPGHYAAQVINSNGQLVYQKDMIVQVNFIDDNFIIPAKFGTGMYTLVLGTVDWKVQKTFMIGN